MAASLVTASLVPVVRATVIIVVIGAIALVNVRGVKSGARLVTAATALKLFPLLVLVVVGIAAVHRANFTAPPALRIEGIGRALILATFALTGALRLLMLGGTAFAMFGMIAGDILGTPRMVFAFARDGLLPRVLGRVHPRSHTPHVAILSYAAIAIVLALTGSFAELAVLATLTTAALYIAGCIAAWLLARRGVALVGAPLALRWLGPVTVVGVGSMLLLVLLASRTEIAGLAALLAVSSLVYLLQTRAAYVRDAT